MTTNEKIPTWLRNNVKNYEENGIFREMTICSSNGDEIFEVWYYGDLFKVECEEQLYIVDTEEADAVIIGKNIKTGEEILIFDGAKYGYNAMFCDTFNEENVNNRKLKKLDIPPSKLFLSLGYNIDYEEEKEEYEFDKNGEVILLDEQRRISWEDLLTDGIDYLGLYYIKEKGEKIQFADFELA